MRKSARERERGESKRAKVRGLSRVPQVSTMTRQDWVCGGGDARAVYRGPMCYTRGTMATRWIEGYERGRECVKTRAGKRQRVCVSVCSGSGVARQSMSVGIGDVCVCGVLRVMFVGYYCNLIQLNVLSVLLYYYK